MDHKKNIIDEINKLEKQLNNLILQHNKSNLLEYELSNEKFTNLYKQNKYFNYTFNYTIEYEKLNKKYTELIDQLHNITL